MRVFLAEHIESYEQLEILLLLGDERTEWTAQRLSSHLKISQAMTEAALSELHSRGILELPSGASSIRCTGNARVPEFEVTLTRLARVYAERPVEIIRLMTANAIERVRTAALRTFVDAFVLRKD
ncbi:MAG: hypothetical protein WB646_17295 [Steroidobacteraceae bacterium]